MLQLLHARTLTWPKWYNNAHVSHLSNIMIPSKIKLSFVTTTSSVCFFWFMLLLVYCFALTLPALHIIEGDLVYIADHVIYFMTVGTMVTMPVILCFPSLPFVSPSVQSKQLRYGGPLFELQMNAWFCVEYYPVQLLRSISSNYSLKTQNGNPLMFLLFNLETL